MPTPRISEKATSSKPLRLITIGAVICVCLLLATGFSACTKKRTPPPPEDMADRVGPVSETLKVDLFFDATLSMRGFVSTETATTYQLTVPLLERGVIEGWNGGQATFYKFGDDIAPLLGREYLDATKPKFYGDSKYNKRTFIERVIDRAKPDRLTVIVTDLFQDNADVNQLSDKLKQKFIANNLAIGVYSIRSQFQGMVYDVGSDDYSFKYESGEKSDTYRPFYLLAFGSHADTAHYFDVLAASGVNSFPETHTLILSRHVTSHPASFSGARLKAADRISEISTSNLLSREYNGDRVKAFKISKGKTTAKLTIELPYAPLSNVMDYGNDLTPEITAWRGEDTGGKELVLVDSPQAQKAFRVSASLLPEQVPFNKLHLQAEISVSELPAAGIYRYQILLRPSRYSLPDWIAMWNMRDEEIKNWHQHPQDFNGARTYNLDNFLRTLQGAVLSTTPPKVCDIYFYIRVDR